MTPPSSRRGERAAAEPRKPVEVQADTPVTETPDVISLEEVEEAGADVPAEEDEEIVDLGDDAPEIPAAGEDDTFLEEEEEGEADVSGIVGGDKGEES